MRDIYIYPEKSGSGGRGTEDDPLYSARSTRTNGLSVLAFGIALATTFLILFMFVGWLRPYMSGETEFTRFVFSIKPTDWLSYILYGFFTGFLIAAIYNLLMVRDLNFLGLESNID